MSKKEGGNDMARGKGRQGGARIRAGALPRYIYVN